VRIFGKKCVDMRVREAAVLMASDSQPRLDMTDLGKWAQGFGLGLTLFHGWPSLVEQVLFWSELPKPVAASRAVPAIHARLVEIEASPKAIDGWVLLTKSAR
jgi:hypothetical protein